LAAANAAFYVFIMNKQTIENLEKLIFKASPIFGRIMKKYGHKSLYDYSKEFLNIQVNSRLEGRRSLCLQIVQNEVEKRLGKKVSMEVEKQLMKVPLVNTMDHHSIIDHPFWINTNLVTSLAYKEAKRKKILKNLIVFSFASISINNPSGFPRGLLFHGGDAGEGPLIRLPILADKWKMRTTYGTPAYTLEDLNRAKSLLVKKEREGLISKRRVQQINELIFSELEKEDILKSENLCEQITKINYRLWPKYFSGKNMPNLIYIEAESITRELLLQEVLDDETCLLYKILFKSRIRKKILKYFEGISGSFSRKDDSGTYFFWSFDEKGHRIRLILEGNKLISKDGKFELELEPNKVRAALENTKIFPSTMLIYLFLSLHYGFKCLGGFAQVNDLTRMKEALLHALVDLGFYNEIYLVCKIQTKEFGGDGPVLAYIRNDKKELIPATGIDLLLSEEKLSYDDYQAMSHKLSLREMLAPMLPEIYTVFYPSYKREEVEILTSEEIIKQTGLQTKIDNILSQFSKGKLKELTAIPKSENLSLESVK
jgi:hypothetical protein